MDLGRNVRCGMPEVVLAEGKDPAHLAAIAIRHAQAAGRCVVTRISREQVGPIRASADTAGNLHPNTMKPAVSLSSQRGPHRKRPAELWR